LINPSGTAAVCDIRSVHQNREEEENASAFFDQMFVMQNS
jgi:hypothetical protein